MCGFIARSLLFVLIKLRKIIYEDADFHFLRKGTKSFCIISVKKENIGRFIEGIRSTLGTRRAMTLIFTLSLMDWSVYISDPITLLLIDRQRNAQSFSIGSLIGMSLFVFASAWLGCVFYILPLPTAVVMCISGIITPIYLFNQHTKSRESAAKREQIAVRRRNETRRYVSITSTFLEADKNENQY